jgi:hypothetical protein
MITHSTNSDSSHTSPYNESHPRFFLDDAIDATCDGDWWLDLGLIDLPISFQLTANS